MSHQGGYPVFVGRSYQRGAGFGSIMASLFRNVLVPAAKKFAVPAAKKLGRSIVRAGVKKSANVIENVIQGKTLKEAITQGPSAPNRKRKAARKPKAAPPRKRSKVVPPGKRSRNVPPGKRAKPPPNDIWSNTNKGRSV